MHRLSYLIAASSVLFSLLIGYNAFFGTYGLSDTAAVKDSIEGIKENEAALEKIAATLAVMQNDFASDDFCLLEGRKLSLYTADDVVIQIDGYSKKGISEEYGSIRVISQPTPPSVIRVLYSIAGAVAFFSFLIFVIGGGLETDGGKTDFDRQFRSHHSGSRG